MDLKKIINDFPWLKNNKDVIYFDNSSTSLKPQVVIDEIVDYYETASVNTHSHDYPVAIHANKKMVWTRNIIKEFINANSIEEIILTSGTTESLNMLADSLSPLMNKDDEIILTKAEHASNILPWIELINKKQCKIKYAKVTDLQISVEEIKKVLTSKTKIVSLAHVTNTLGYVAPLKEIIKEVKKFNPNIYVVVDAAQSIAHLKTDVQDIGCDFLAFSGHKMCAPTGVGVLWGKKNLLEKLKPSKFGGGMNITIHENDYTYNQLPYKFEAGSQNVSGILGLGKACEYLLNIGMDNIHNYEVELKKYFVKKAKESNKIEIYNENTKSGIILFNIIGVFAEDVSSYFGIRHKICLRSGQSCAKLVPRIIGKQTYVRASLYIYNTKEEIDRFFDIVNKTERGDYIDLFF